MYAACTFAMAHALELEFLYPLLPYLGYVAFAVWASSSPGSSARSSGRYMCPSSIAADGLSGHAMIEVAKSARLTQTRSA
jgi:hypothetical protein